MIFQGNAIDLSMGRGAVTISEGAEDRWGASARLLLSWIHLWNAASTNTFPRFHLGVKPVSAGYLMILSFTNENGVKGSGRKLTTSSAFTVMPQLGAWKQPTGCSYGWK